LTGSDRMSDWYPNQMDLVRAAMEERPFTEVPDAQGRLVDAAPALEQAQLLVDQANAEADKAFKAATDCFDRGDRNRDANPATILMQRLCGKSRAVAADSEK